MRAGLIGLGIMGSAYARHLCNAGIETSGFDVDPAACARFAELGGRVAESPADVAGTTDVVIIALASAGALEAASFGAAGLASGARRGLVVSEQSTFDLGTKLRLRDGLAARGVEVLDAPVSGTGMQAQSRDLTVFASGERTVFSRAEPIMKLFARDVRYVGAFGAGSKLKFIANLLVTIHNLAAAEAVVLAERAGIDPAIMLDALDGSAADSRMLRIRGPQMAESAYLPAAMKMEVFAKDLAIIERFARELGVPTPLFDRALPIYAAALSAGHAKHDSAAIVEVLRAGAADPEPHA